MKRFIAIALAILIGGSALSSTKQGVAIYNKAESIITEATAVFKEWVPSLEDKDPDEELSYEDQLNIVQSIYAKYDNGDFEGEDNFCEYLEGYSNHVDDLNSYHDFLDECGVPGPNVQIDIRGNKNAK